MTAATVELWFEFASTYSYPAALRVEAVAEKYGCEVRWRPFLLGPIFKAQGWSDSPFNLFPAKGRYMWRDLARSCEELGLPFVRPSIFPRNGLLAARVACARYPAPWLPAFVRAVYTANFEHDKDISRPEVLTECLAPIVPDADAVLAEAAQDGAKARLRRHTETAAKLGIFGSPSFVVGDELFWGNDRMEAAMRWAQR